MKISGKLFLITITALVATQAMIHASEQARFEWFQYQGMDPVFDTVLDDGQYRNPLIAGFYPDPSICRVGDRYYLINSSFSYFPGIPIFESTDLVNWKQIGHVLDRTSQLDTKGTRISRGIYAPTIRHHDGLFYVIVTLVDRGGNFIVTATDPAGPWSDPLWLPEIDGIDPDIFFDDDGRFFITHNGPPPKNESLYNGHRAIWLWEYDLKKQSFVGEGRIIVNGGVDITKNPVWIEAPHLYKKDGWYYLSCAEGGTSTDHSQVIFRTRSLDEDFIPFPTPILTQRNLPVDRIHPIACTGHVDFVETQEGEWWAVFLATRPYGERYYHTGRETFMLPMSWSDEGWPEILPPGEVVPYSLKGPSLYDKKETIGFSLTTGNFLWKDDFSEDNLGFEWVMLRTPNFSIYDLGKGSGIVLQAQSLPLSSKECPTYIGRRQQHTHFLATTRLNLKAIDSSISAGLAVYQSENAHVFLGVRMLDQGGMQLFVEETEKGERTIIQTWNVVKDLAFVDLSIQENAGKMRFQVLDPSGNEMAMLQSMDSSFLSTQKAGGFVGCTIGLHARLDEHL